MTLVENFQFFSKHAIESNNTYIEKSHMDNNNCIMLANSEELIKELYNPVKMLVEPPKNVIKPLYSIPEQRIERSITMNKHRNWTRKQHKEHSIKQLFSQYYSIYKCNELKELYANENGIVYDYVIRMRFDAMPREILYCHNYDPNFIYYQDLGQTENLISEILIIF